MKMQSIFAVSDPRSGPRPVPEKRRKLISRTVIAPLAGAALLLPGWSSAELILETEANNSLATAQPIDGHFTLDFHPDIGNGTHVDNTSTTIPHVSIRGSGDGTFDYYSFYFPGPGLTTGFVVLDIDDSSSGFDSWVGLWASDGTLLGHNDDYDYRGGAGGSVAHYSGTMSYDSLMTTYITTPGTYIVGVAKAPASPLTGGFDPGSATPGGGDLYTLQISVEGVPVVPEPSSCALVGVGAMWLSAAARRRRKTATRK